MSSCNHKSPNYKAILDSLQESSEEVRFLFENKIVEMVILTGSFVQGNYDLRSDIDLYFIVSLKNEKKYRIPPEHSELLDFNGTKLKIEVSIVSLEKVHRDLVGNAHYYWWHKSILLYAKDDKYTKIHKKLSCLSYSEIKDKLWTLYFMFKMGQEEYIKFNIRYPEHQITENLIYYENIKYFLEAQLIGYRIYKRFKWFQKEFEYCAETNKDISTLIMDSQTINERVKTLKVLQLSFERLLLKEGFDVIDIKNWSKRNLERIEFQKY